MRMGYLSWTPAFLWRILQTPVLLHFLILVTTSGADSKWHGGTCPPLYKWLDTGKWEVKKALIHNARLIAEPKKWRGTTIFFWSGGRVPLISHATIVTTLQRAVVQERIWMWGGALVGSKKNFVGRVPPILALKVQLVVLVSAFVMVSTVWSVSCLLFFYSRCPRAPWSWRHWTY